MNNFLSLFTIHYRMQNLKISELRSIPKGWNINGYLKKQLEDLFANSVKSKIPITRALERLKTPIPSPRTKTSVPLPRPKKTVPTKSLVFFQTRTENSGIKEKKIDDNILENVRNYFRLRKENEAVKDKITRDI